MVMLTISIVLDQEYLHKLLSNGLINMGVVLALLFGLCKTVRPGATFVPVHASKSPMSMNHLLPWISSVYRCSRAECASFVSCPLTLIV